MHKKENTRAGMAETAEDSQRAGTGSKLQGAKGANQAFFLTVSNTVA